MEAGAKKMTDDKGMANLSDVISIGSKNCRCNELEERSEKAEARCAELEIELQRKHSQCESLEAKLKALEVEKFAVEEELNVLRVSSENHKGGKQISNEPDIIQPSSVLCQGSGNISVPTRFAAEIGKVSNTYCGNNEDDLTGEDLPFVAIPKRKRTLNVVTSESEGDDDNDGDDDDGGDDDDDNVPISKLMRMHNPEAGSEHVKGDLNSSATTTFADDKNTCTVPPRRRLVPLRKSAREKECKKSSNRSNKAKHQESIPTNACESEEDLSNSENDGLSDFIVDDSDVSNFDDESSKSYSASKDGGDSDSSNSQDVPDNDTGSDSQDESDGEGEFGMILSQIQRRKDHITKWEYEADMLAAFGKDPVLCMKAVCVLYRQQTSEEQMSRGSHCFNQRGFSKFDAPRGSTLAEFLTNGDPSVDLKKSVKELEEFDPEAVELCSTLAVRYSRQLYEIYKNKEDPFFP